MLLYGPPGCGKTLISKATAGEIHANFISVGIHQILDLYVGNSEKNLHQRFSWPGKMRRRFSFSTKSMPWLPIARIFAKAPFGP